jgi:hypothetical protein
LVAADRLGEVLALVHYANHPPDPEAVDNHAEARGPEGFAQGHLHLAAFSERGKFPPGISLVRRRQ